MRPLAQAQWVVAGLVAVALHGILLIATEVRLYGEVSPPAGPSIESAASFAGIVGAAVEVEADGASAETIEAVAAEQIETTTPDEITEVAAAQPSEPAAVEASEVESAAALVVPETIASTSAIPAAARPVQPPEVQEISPQTAGPQRAEVAQEVQTIEPPTAKPQRAKPRQTRRPTRAARRGNADTGNAGSSRGGRSGRSTASVGAVNAYAAQVRARILARSPRGGGARGTTVIRFGLSSSGRLRFASIARSSGNRVLDARALAAVRGTSFPRPPRGASSSQLRFSIPFHFR